MHPKFEVGEVVILQSRELPQCNCETTVTNSKSSPKFGWAYELEFKHYVKGSPVWWAESALRKKHIPGELNFRQLMTSLSSPKLLTHSPR